MTDMKRFDLMMGINTRGTFMVSKYCIPHLKKAANPHILMLSPPLDMKAKWFEHSTAYTIAKFGMSMCVLGLSAELKSSGIAVNALWPRTTIATAAVGNLLGGEAMIIAGIHWTVLHRRQGSLRKRRARFRALSRRSGRAAGIRFLRTRRRRPASRRYRKAVAVRGRGPEVELKRDAIWLNRHRASAP
jgi:NAD(P)-dependent dehydrogenase (short-subunit alcohol dehydrogenase family)